MKPLRRFLARLLNFATKRSDQRLREEMEEHLAFQTAENLRRGMAPAEARRQAVLKFGAEGTIKEDYHAEQGLPFIETLLQDVRYALRLFFAKSPGFASRHGSDHGSGHRSDDGDFPALSMPHAVTPLVVPAP